MSVTNKRPRARRGSAARLIGWVAVGSMLAVAMLGPSAASTLGASVSPIALPNDVVTDNNPNCDHVDGPYGGGQTWLEVKLQDENLGNVWVLVDDMGTEDESDDHWIKVTNYQDSSSGTAGSFDWESNFGIDAVLVKAGNDKHHLYVYAATAGSAEWMSDTGLGPQSGQGNGISHINFCYDKESPPPSEAPSETPSEEPTETPSEAPPSEAPPSEAPPSEAPPSEAPPSEAPPSEAPSEAPSASEAPIESESPSFSGGVGGATGTPSADTTLPPTDGISSPMQPAGDTWRMLLVVMAGLLASVLLLTPSRSAAKR
jgi:hypothetical protein